MIKPMNPRESNANPEPNPTTELGFRLGKLRNVTLSLPLTAKKKKKRDPQTYETYLQVSGTLAMIAFGNSQGRPIIMVEVF